MTTADLLSSGLGVAVSLVTSYVPFVSEWFYKQDKKYRGLWMILFTFIVALVIFGLSCGGVFNFVACSEAGAMDLLRAFFYVIVGNQLAYLVSPESPTKGKILASEKAEWDLTVSKSWKVI